MPTHRPRALVWAASAVLAGGFAALALSAPPGTNALVSRPSGFGPLTTPVTNDSSVDGSGLGVGDAAARTVSDAGTGRYVAFVSAADGLSDADDDRVANVFLRDRLTNETILVSRADGSAGAGANAFAGQPSLSQDGRYVAFASPATNLVPGADDGESHVYVRDVVAGTTTLVDRADGALGAVGNGVALDPSITLVGGAPVVAFSSSATNLDGAIPPFSRQIYVRDGLDMAMVSRRDSSTAPNANAPGLGLSSNPSISSDGTTVAFESNSTNLVSDDPNGLTDVFARVRASGLTELVSRNPIQVGNGASTHASISGDGVRVAFVSQSTNLVLIGDPDTADDVYVRDLATDQVTLASRAGGLSGAKGDGSSPEAAISDDGLSVVFTSGATNLVPGDTNGYADIFVRDSLFTASPTTDIVNRPAPGVETDGPSFTPSIARAATNGIRAVAFTTGAANLGGDDENDFAQVYVREIGVGASPAAAYVSRPAGTAAFRSGVNTSSLRPQLRSSESVTSISADGRYVVFLSGSDELSPMDDDNLLNVFRRDNLTGETALVSRADGPEGAAANAVSGIGGAPAISADGRRIAFTSAGTNLVAGDTNNAVDVFVRDVAAGTTVRASVAADGSQLPVTSGEAAISRDGNRVAFVTSFAIAGGSDANNVGDVYLRDLTAATTTLVSRVTGAGAAGNQGSTNPALDGAGVVVAFESNATNLVPGIFDLNAGTDVFVHDVSSGQTRLVSVNAAGTAAGNDDSGAPALGADGGRVAFSSGASDLVGPVDVNGVITDVFLRDLAGNATTLVSAKAGGQSGNAISERPSISADGTRIAFESLATDIVSPDVNGAFDVLVRDTAAATSVRAGVATGAVGAQLATGAGTPSLSGDGSCIVFETTSADVGGLPPGSDFVRVVARALRGDCPFGPVVTTPTPPGGQGPGPGPGGGPGPAGENARPAVTGVRIAPARFLAGRRLQPATRRRPAIGARLRLTLSEAARVTVKVDLLRPGKRAGKRCVAPKPSLRRAKACFRPLGKGTLTFANRRQGANTIAITGRVGRRTLAPGTYRLTVRARDAAGLLSVARTVRVTILAPRR